MTLLQLLMLGASAYFALKIYEHINSLEDLPLDKQEQSTTTPMKSWKKISPSQLVEDADAAYANEDYEDAKKFLEEAKELQPQDDEILFKLGFVNQKLGNKDQALRYYKEALELDRDNEYIYNAMASLYREHGEYAQAQIQLDASLERNPNNAQTYFNYGNLLVDMQRVEDAKEMYAKAFEIDPELLQAKEELEKLQKETM